MPSSMIAPVCNKCGGPTQSRTGRFGKFWGCMDYPKCNGIVKATYQKKAPVPISARKNLIPSAEQKAIFEYALNGTGHMICQALAGTGKSTTAREILFKVSEKRPNLKLGYTSFGKDSVEEFKSGAVPVGVEVCTMNAYGNRIIKSNNYRAMFSQKKLDNIIEELWKPQTTKEIDIQRTLTIAVKKVVELCQSYMVEATVPNIDDLIERHGIEMSGQVAELAYELIPKVMKLDRERTNTYSYSGQLWLPVVLNMESKQKFDIMIVDEAQDLNKIQHHLLMKLLAPGGRMFIIGDFFQCIFGFRGSDVDSMDNLSALLEAETNLEIKTFPLTVCRRCPKKVIALAQKYVPAIKAMDDAEEGNIINAEYDTVKYAVGDMVLCRVNAPLAPIAYKLIRQGVKAVIRGRDIGQGLITLIDRMRASNVSELTSKLEDWATEQCEKYSGCRRAAEIQQNITDQVDCIKAFSDAGSISGIKDVIAAIFDDVCAGEIRKNSVVLSSIHRAKGLEADRVVWINPNHDCKVEQDWQYQQELNLKYVATTRSKNILVLVEGTANLEKKVVVGS